MYVHVKCRRPKWSWKIYDDDADGDGDAVVYGIWDSILTCILMCVASFIFPFRFFCMNWTDQPLKPHRIENLKNSPNPNSIPVHWLQYNSLCSFIIWFKIKNSPCHDCDARSTETGEKHREREREKSTAAKHIGQIICSTINKFSISPAERYGSVW